MVSPNSEPGPDGAEDVRPRAGPPIGISALAVLAPLVVAAIVVVNAWAGLMPGVGFWDTGEFQAVLPILGTAHPTGYPTYVLLGFVANLLLAPIGEPAFRINALSLIAVAIAAGATVALVRRLTGSTAVALVAGLGLATTPVVWANATRADPHPIHLMFVALLLLALVRWEDARRAADGRREPYEGEAADGRVADRRLLIAAALFGIAAGNHSLMLLLVPPIGLFVLSVEPSIWRRWRFALACLGAALGAMALVYLELPIRGGLIPAELIYGRPATWSGFWDIALAEQFRGSLGNPFADLPEKLDDLVRIVNEQLGVVAFAVLPAVIVTARRAPRYLLLTGSAMLITVLFNQAYSNADISRYYLGPALWIWTWLAILAAELAAVAGLLVADAIARTRRLARADDRLVARGTALVALALGLLLLAPTIADLESRRHDRNLGIDRSGDTGAQRWLDQALAVLPQDAVLVSWWSTSTPLWYTQHVRGLRRDIFVVDDRTMLDMDLGRAPDVIARYLGQRPVYAIRLAGRDTEELASQYDMTKVASDGHTAVWRVDGRLPGAP